MGEHHRRAYHGPAVSGGRSDYQYVQPLGHREQNPPQRSCDGHKAGRADSGKCSGTTVLPGACPLWRNRIKVANHRISDLEKMDGGKISGGYFCIWGGTVAAITRAWNAFSRFGITGVENHARWTNKITYRSSAAALAPVLGLVAPVCGHAGVPGGRTPITAAALAWYRPAATGINRAMRQLGKELNSI